MITDNRVSHIFNEMEEEYDEIVDLWYSWLFSRLHYFLVKHVLLNLSKSGELKVLDVGCGTGFQSILFALAGCRVKGVDISEKLIEVAKNKELSSPHNFMLFPEEYSFVQKYNDRISALLKAFDGAKVLNPVYEVMDATSLQFEVVEFDVISCCGSTLSFVEDYRLALTEYHRCLKRGGTLVLEIEAKRNLDLVWTLLDSSIFCGKLGYETTFSEALDLVFGHIGKHVSVEYPFGDVKSPVYMNIRLFHKRKLLKELKNMGFEIQRTYSIHSLTNVLPSTILDSEKPSKTLIKLFKILLRLEEAIGYKFPGCSLFIVARKAR